MRTIVLGLGNPILGDDSIGWQVAQRVKTELEKSPRREIEVDQWSLGGIALMERLVGYERAILIDAIQTPGGAPGTIYRLTLDDLPTRHASSAHDASLQTALDLGRRMGASLPEEIIIIAVEVAGLWEFSESLSPAVAASLEPAAAMALAELGEKKT